MQKIGKEATESERLRARGEWVAKPECKVALGIRPSQSIPESAAHTWRASECAPGPVSECVCVRRSFVVDQAAAAANLALTASLQRYTCPVLR